MEFIVIYSGRLYCPIWQPWQCLHFNIRRNVGNCLPVELT